MAVLWDKYHVESDGDRGGAKLYLKFGEVTKGGKFKPKYRSCDRTEEILKAVMAYFAMKMRHEPEDKLFIGTKNNLGSIVYIKPGYKIKEIELE